MTKSAESKQIARGTNPIFAVSTQLMRVARTTTGRHLLCPRVGAGAGHSSAETMGMNNKNSLEESKP